MSQKMMLHVSKAFAQSDLRPLLDALDESIVWKAATSSKGDEIRFGGVHVGIVEVKQHLATIAADYKVHRTLRARRGPFRSSIEALGVHLVASAIQPEVAVR